MTTSCLQRVITLGASTLLLVAHGYATPNWTNPALPLYSVYPDLKDQIIPPSGNPLLGHQNFTYGCCLAVESYLEDSHNTDIVIGGVASPDDPFRVLDPNDPFPCTAQYGDDSSKVHTVQVSYTWCSNNTNGWEVSRSSKLSQWIQPFVGFILPSVIFSLNVPRRRKINAPDWLFPPEIDTPKGAVVAVFCALLADVVVAIDTIVWLLTVFALSGPLILSGLHEAWLDKRLLDFMSDKFRHRYLPIHMRANLLYAVLVGNLDLETAWEPTRELTSKLAGTPYRNLDPGERDTRATPAFREVQMQLNSMLACQYSFGSAIGAPVVFYIGSFIFAILEIRSVLGDNDTAHALGFGMWWMTIPHVAIVSGCLLRGNNPNTLEGIAPHIQKLGLEQPANAQASFQSRLSKAAQRLYRPTYDAQYKPTWMWS